MLRKTEVMRKEEEWRKNDELHKLQELRKAVRNNNFPFRIWIKTLEYKYWWKIILTGYMTMFVLIGGDATTRRAP